MNQIGINRKSSSEESSTIPAGKREMIFFEYQTEKNKFR